jgi:hypothetical protein
MKYSNKILYIGANCHIEPVNHFKETKEFVFIDSQPRSEFDSFHPKFYKFCYRRQFYSNLIELCQQHGFILESTYELDGNYHKKIMSLATYVKYFIKGFPEYINPTLLVFRNNASQQVIHYYISTNIKFNMKPILQLDIESCDGIIVAGYHPDIELLEYIKQPISLFGYTGTSYIIEKPIYNIDTQNIIYFLQTGNRNIKYYFNNFFAVVKETGIIYKCTSFNDFKFVIEKNKLISTF